MIVIFVHAIYIDYNSTPSVHHLSVLTILVRISMCRPKFYRNTKIVYGGSNIFSNKCIWSAIIGVDFEWVFSHAWTCVWFCCFLPIFQLKSPTPSAIMLGTLKLIYTYINNSFRFSNMCSLRPVYNSRIYSIFRMNMARFYI